MARKICCPSCASLVTKKCDVFYEQGVSTVYGPNYVTTRMTSFAMRSAPPSPPVKAGDSESGPVVITLIGVLMMTVAMLIKAHGGFVFLGATVLGLGMYFWWEVQPAPGQREAEAQRYQAQVQQYWADLELYKKLWICLDCGKIFIPPGKPSNYVANQEGTLTRVSGLLLDSITTK
jgi:hypothetical protein